ncbi:MAG: glycosyltransferase family 39 protein [Ardenticatenia bacterium]|nr:glycosyltransferase family 39 protein [Ardenticatenia bacterium]
MLILAGYLILSAAYSVVNPAFESPDEIHHYAYVDYLLRERSLPIAELGGPESEHHQPPLYYLLSSAVAAPVVEAQNPYAAVQRNPFWGWCIGQVGVDNKNQFVHGEAEAFPYRDWALRLHLVRWLSVALQMLTVIAAYLTGREVFPDRPAICLGALAFVAFLPQFLFVSSSVSNDNLIIPLSALIIWLLARSVRQTLTTRHSVALGVLVGLAVLTKMSGLALLPLALVTVTLVGWRDHAWHQVGWAWVALFCLPALLAAPILSRNLRLYGEPTALRRMSEIWGQHDPPLSYAKALWQVPNVWTSFWARFGYGQIPVSNSIYQVLLVIVGLAIVGLIIWLIRERRRLAAVTYWQLLLLVAVGGLYAFLLLDYTRVSLTGGNGRFAFPALPAYALLLFLGLSGWLPRRWHNILALVAHAGMLAFALIALVVYLRPAYTVPHLLRQKSAPPHPVELRFGELMILHGYALDREVMYPGDDLTITLYWQALATPDTDYTVFVHLLGPHGELLGARDTYPALGRFPTTQWQPGDVLADPVPVPVRPDAATVAPAAVRLEVGLYELVAGKRLPIVDVAGNPVDSPIVGRIKLVPRHWPQWIPSTLDHHKFGNKIALLGYDLPATAQPGQTLDFTLYWQALAQPTHDYTVFIHMLDTAGEVVAQADAPPLAGAYPTSLWASPEMLADHRHLRLPDDLLPGDYRLRIGLYNLADGRRLSVLDEDDNPLSDSVVLPAVHVGEGNG